MHIKIGLYRHYKGNLYQVIGLARHTEISDEIFVVYQAMQGDFDLFVRPYQMFIELVQYQEKTVARFEFLSSNFETLELSKKYD